MIRLRKHLLRLAFAWACGALAVSASADDWGAFASISSTMGVSGSRICIGEASRGDLGCPTYAPSVTTAGDVSVTGNLSAAKFIGDGSALTGISSGVSVTTGASGSLVYRDAYGSLVASSGLSISSTTGSVGIGAGAPSYVGNNGFYAAGNIASSNQLLAAEGGAITFSGTNYITGMRGYTTSDPRLYFLVSNTEAMRIVSSGYVGIGTNAPSYTLHVSGTAYAGSFAGNSAYINYVQIATAASIKTNSYPSTTFDVGGTIRIANSGEACDANRKGAIKYTANEFYVCRNGSAWESLTFIATAATPDRITSGTTTLLATNGGSLTTTAPLEVSGTISATTVQLANNPSTACSAATDGMIKVVNGRPFICRHLP